ncbi:MAG: spore germination protein, partial [Clostridia bacterium]|nr:spore germination protein [Clostridia bacterium]
MIAINKELKKIKRALNYSSDVVTRDIESQGKKIALVYLDGMIAVRTLDLGIVTPLIENGYKINGDVSELAGILATSEKVEFLETLPDALQKVYTGGCLILIEGANGYAVCSAQGFISRAVMEPPVSSVIKGPREGFTESFKTNVTLIRRRFASGKLVFKSLTVGRYSATHIELCYVKGIANPKIVKEIERKIKKIDIDVIIDSSYVAKLLEDRRYSHFKQTGSTEKPDILASKL